MSLVYAAQLTMVLTTARVTVATSTHMTLCRAHTNRLRKYLIHHQTRQLAILILIDRSFISYHPRLSFSTIDNIKARAMSDGKMDIDEPSGSGAPTPAPATAKNAMAALMAGAKAKGKEKASDEKANEAFAMSEAELKALNERDGMPW